MRCGYQNQPGYQFCSNCGALLAAVPGGAPPFPGYAPPTGVPSAPGGVPYPGSAEYERARQVDRTKTGTFLLLIGSLLSWIPLIQIVGYLLILVGVILVILGRKAFGPEHSRNVVISIILFFVGIIVVIGVAVAAAVSNLSGIIGPGGTVTLTPAFLAGALNAGLLGGIVAAFIVGIAEVLFTYGLQAQPGRILLWAAYGANIALSIAIYLILSPLLSSVATQADYDRVIALQGTYVLLNVVPGLLFAAADYLAWSRISRGEIPAPAPAVAGVPVASPPGYPPMPPQAPPSGPAPPINPQ